MARPRSRKRRQRSSSESATYVTYVQPSVRSFTTWTPRLIRSALSTADGGSLRLVSDLCEWCLGDERVKADLETVLQTLLGLELSFEAGGDGRRRNKVVRALEADEDWWTLHPESELKQLAIWGLLLGIGLAERVPPESVDPKTGRLLPPLRFWNPRNLRQDTTTGRWFLRVGAHGGEEIEIEPGDGRWVLYLPYGAERPWASGLWRGLSRWVLLKHYAVQDWGAAGENASRMFIETPNRNAFDQRKELVSDIFSLGRNAIIALPPEFKASLVEKSASSIDLYEKQIGTADTAITIAIRGQNLGTQVEGGSFAAASAHVGVDMRRTAFVGESLSTTIHDQSLEPWAADNFGDPSLAPWASWDTTAPREEKAAAEVLKTIGEAAKNLGDVGVRLDWKVVGEQFGIPIDRVEEPTKPPHPPPPDPLGGPSAAPSPDDAPSTNVAPPPAAPAQALASGMPLAAASGFVDGQTYADALVARGQQRGSEQLAGLLDSLDELIDGIDDLDTAQVRIVELFGAQEPPERLADLSMKLFLLAQLGGAAAARQDLPSIEDEDGDS